MENKVLQFEKSVDRYIKLGLERADNEDFTGALKFFLSAKSIEEDNLDVLLNLADVYADMGQLDISNRCWFRYIDKAPKERLAVAYEELAINYFYLDNFWASSYYFHKKLSIDGFISKEGLAPEIVEFFSGEEIKKTAYRIAYPIERADYTHEIKKAKHLIALGAFDEGASQLERIPLERLDEETAGELAVCYFMSDRLDDAEDVCRLSLERHGANVTAFCNLSTVYDMKDDLDNSDYYYQKALSIRKGETAEVYKIATCAIEREDHKTARDCLKAILDDRPHEYAMRFFYGIALCNLGDYEGAVEQIQRAHLIDAEDISIKFHLDYIKGLASEKGDYLDLLPFKYVKEIPEKIQKSWKRKLSALVKTPEKFSSAIKKEEWRTILEWALKLNDGQTLRDAAYVLSSNITPYAKNVLFKTMLSPDGGEEVKRVLIYVAVLSGIKEKFGVVAGSFYLKIKPKRLLCDKDKIFGGLYLSSYALCLSKMAFFDVEGLDKIGKVCDKIYKKFRGKITDSEATNEEIAGLILSECGFKNYSSDFGVLRLFSISKEKLRALKNMLKGENHD